MACVDLSANLDILARMWNADDRTSRFARWFCRVMLIAALPPSLPAHAENGDTGKPHTIQFASPRECVRLARQPARLCAQIAQHVWQLYLSQVPRFDSIESCWRAYNVCAPLPPDWLHSGGRESPLQAKVKFAPPLAGVRLNPARPFDEFVILIDRGMKPMSVLSTTAILPVGKFAPTPAMLVGAYEQTLRGDNGRPTDARPSRAPGAEEDLRPEDVFPVPPSRLRNSRPIRDRF